eukprot:CAMPEP_0116869784 /NCGR_PEP_ID=MMETSP0418-20121206/27948_1 /TAXON_ID=1158023 /ORGANISM="Astrosyne radiata, Strain 13vi08-1A" /LENGTH=355 /DNA_ID=CAMNT_0004505911 /DNA_START=30 /DNA_END=1098 /DNA_ORIENTATION=+
MTAEHRKASSKDVEAGIPLEEEGDDKKNEHLQEDVDAPKKPPPVISAATSSTKALTACGMYSFCSVSMVLTNKSLASSYDTSLKGQDVNVLIVVFQAVVAVFCVETCRRLKWVEYPPLNSRVARLWAPVNILFCFMLFTGMASLQYNSVPMVTVFKNITNIVVTIGDVLYFQTTPEPLVGMAFLVMLLGAIFAAWHDIYITAWGLFWMCANCVATAGYILYMKFATQTVQLSKFGMVFVNNVLAIFFLLPASLVRGDVTTLLQTNSLHTMGYFLKNVFAGLVGFFLNFASLNCVAATGPTTYAIVGSLNKIPVAIFGYLLFDNLITPESWFFICVSMCGGFLYSYAKIRSNRGKL